MKKLKVAMQGPAENKDKLIKRLNRNKVDFYEIGVFPTGASEEEKFYHVEFACKGKTFFKKIYGKVKDLGNFRIISE